MPELNTITCADALSYLKGLPSGFVQCVCTSPPYWALRDYQAEGQLGLEKTPQEYVENMVAVFAEVKRVLRDDGVCFINLGDSYAHNGPCGGGSPDGPRKPRETDREKQKKMRYRVPPGLKPLNLCGIPWRVAFALQADGWFLRCDIIYSKKNPMPESVSGWRWERHRVKVKAGGHTGKVIGGVEHRNQGGKNLRQTEYRDCPGCEKCEPNGGLVLRKGSWRPTRSHEYVFMLTKTANYYCDGEAVKEPHAPASEERSRYDRKADKTNKGRPTGRNRDDGGHMFASGLNALPYTLDPAGRNRRSVWHISTQSFPGAHFATYPEALVRPCIQAATSEKGCCPKCGAQWARVIRRITNYEDRKAAGKHEGEYQRGRVTPRGAPEGDFHDLGTLESTTLRWHPSCNCATGKPQPCIVLDPFAGAGTTMLVAEKLGRNWIGCDISQQYVDMAMKRVKAETELPLFEEGTT